MAIYENITRIDWEHSDCQIESSCSEGAADVMSNSEAFNPGSSVKDRIALSMIEKAEAGWL